MTDDALDSLTLPTKGELARLGEELRDTDRCSLDGLWSAALADALTREASGQWGHASLAIHERYETVEGVLAGPLRQYWNDRGPLLRRLHHDPRFLSLVEQIGGRSMVPVQAAYLYYREGGYCGLHTDRPDFEIQLMISVIGDMGPLLMRPDLAATPVTELAGRCAAQEVGDGGLEVWYPRLGVTVFSGTRVPHHRPPHLSAELGAVAGLNYRSASNDGGATRGRAAR